MISVILLLLQKNVIAPHIAKQMLPTSDGRCPLSELNSLPRLYPIEMPMHLVKYHCVISTYNMSHVMRKNVFRMCDEARLKLGCSATENTKSLKRFYLQVHVLHVYYLCSESQRH